MDEVRERDSMAGADEEPTRIDPAAVAVAVAQLAVAAGLTYVAAAVAGGATAEGLAWFEQLDRPGWLPTEAAFGGVRSLLYVLLALALWVVWRVAGRRAWAATVLYVVLLAADAAWSTVLFGQQRPVAGLAAAVVLLGAAAGTASAFARWSAAAAWLLAPYLVWVVLAAVTNAAVVGLGA